MKRLVDVTLSGFGLAAASPVLLPVIALIYAQDRHSPFYVAPRVGKGEKIFKMIKLRSMVVNADKTGVDSTSSRDPRITAVGRFVRRYKLDELPQLLNVLKGDMSLVGPRPNVKRETDLYTKEEKELLSVRPGITDIASIVFADENEILKDSPDPDIDYNQLIRPWKSRLGILYVRHASVGLDLKLIWLTAMAVANRSAALERVGELLHELHADAYVARVARRTEPLRAHPPPGAVKVVTSRE